MALHHGQKFVAKTRLGMLIISQLPFKATCTPITKKTGKLPLILRTSVKVPICKFLACFVGMTFDCITYYVLYAMILFMAAALHMIFLSWCLTYCMIFLLSLQSEMGGFDGTNFSNSYAFHKALDWKGVLIEASPTNYALMVKNRPSELATIHAGICAQEQELHFVNKANGGKGAVSGFVEFAAESFKETWWSKEDIQNAEIVRCASLTTVLEEAVGPNFHFDFFSLDVEGAEYDVLMSLNFDLFSFGIIFVEADNHNPAKNDKLRQLLASKGYKFKHHSRNSDWFVNMKFDEIYKQGSK